MTDKQRKERGLLRCYVLVDKTPSSNGGGMAVAPRSWILWKKHRVETIYSNQYLAKSHPSTGYWAYKICMPFPWISDGV